VIEPVILQITVLTEFRLSERDLICIVVGAHAGIPTAVVPHQAQPRFTERHGPVGKLHIVYLGDDKLGDKEKYCGATNTYVTRCNARHVSFPMLSGQPGRSSDVRFHLQCINIPDQILNIILVLHCPSPSTILPRVKFLQISLLAQEEFVLLMPNRLSVLTSEICPRSQRTIGYTKESTVQGNTIDHEAMSYLSLSKAYSLRVTLHLSCVGQK